MPMKKTALAVFVHGIGADAENWWGTTPDAFRTDPRLAHIDFHFWRYDTQKHPERWWLLPNFLRSRNLANLQQLGRRLWTDVRGLHGEGQYPQIALFGHSMGGLVVAAAIVEGWPTKSPADVALKSALKVIGMCATPLGGSDVAKLVDDLTAFYGPNEHMKNLCEDSARRKSIVAQLENHVRMGEGGPETVLLEFFEVGEDTTVSTDEERYAGFRDSMERKGRVLSLSGGHSECVQDLSLKGLRRNNYAALSKWLTQHLAATPPAASTPSRAAKPLGETEDASGSTAKDDPAVLLLCDALLADFRDRGGPESAQKLVTQIRRLTDLSGQGVVNAVRFFIEYSLLTSEEPSSPAQLERMLSWPPEENTPNIVNRLRQVGKTGNFAANPITVTSNFFRRTREREKQWKAYFEALVRHTGTPESTVRCVSPLVARLGYIAPQFLIAGLLSRFNEEWKPLVNAYRAAIPDPEQRRGRFESLQASQWNCWLMWGPSIPLCTCDQWKGLFAFQYGYGDENNSIPALEFDTDDGGLPKGLTPISHLLRAERRGARYAKLVGRLRWAPWFLRESVPADKGSFSPARMDDLKEEDSEAGKRAAAPAQSALYSSRGPASRQDRDGLVLQVDSVEASDPETRVYFSAYQWLIFLVALPSRSAGAAPSLLRGKSYPDWPKSQEERLAVRDKGLWADLLPVFVHANIGDPDALAFQRQVLVQNALELLRQVWSERQRLFDRVDVAAGIQFHLVCASDYTGCGCEVRFASAEPLTALLRARLAIEHDSEFAAAVVLPPANETEESRPWELRGFFSSCHLPELVADYYAHVDKVIERERAAR